MPEGYVYTFYVNGMEYNPSTPIYQNTTVSVVMVEDVSAPVYLTGDVNCDGVIDSRDLAIAAAYSMNAGSVTEQGIVNGDMNGDGVLNSSDLPALCAYILG